MMKSDDWKRKSRKNNSFIKTYLVSCVIVKFEIYQKLRN